MQPDGTMGTVLQVVQQPPRLKPDEVTRVTVVAQMTDDPNADLTPRQVKTEEQLYQEFRPAVSVRLVDPDGAEQEVTVRYGRVTDFEDGALLERVPLLRRLAWRRAFLNYVRDQANRNRTFAGALDDPAARHRFAAWLAARLGEMDRALAPPAADEG